jgi:hypothetical protein
LSAAVFSLSFQAATAFAHVAADSASREYEQHHQSRLVQMPVRCTGMKKINKNHGEAILPM